MANNKQNPATKRRLASKNRSNRQISGSINKLMDQMSSMASGISHDTTLDQLRDDFDNLLNIEIKGMNSKAEGSMTGFISKLFADEQRGNMNVSKQLENIFNVNESDLEGFLNDKYRNRLLKQSDIHEVASQLNELREAILIIRDSIVSADIVDGHMSRNFIFSTGSASVGTDYTHIVEQLENKFKLQQKIKNFIIPKTLEFGEYFVYIIPYSELFDDFSKNRANNIRDMAINGNLYRESTVFESAFDNDNDKKSFMNELYGKIPASIIEESHAANTRNEFTNEMTEILGNISVCNHSTPIPFIEEGVESINEYYKEYVNGSSYTTEARKNPSSIEKFNKIIKSLDGTGIHFADDDKKKASKNEFEQFKDCYIKLIDPMHMIPVKIMSQTIGYYYIIEEDITPMSGILSSTLYYNRYDDTKGKDESIIRSISEKIVKSFDKKFLTENEKFKDLIVEALNYYKLNCKKIKFQFIPADYIIPFKVNEDENGDGVSVIEPSLFYAKLYLMLLLFKIMSIVMYSNDTRVNYIKSGIDKNIANKIQEIARKKQQRTINITDLFSYTSMINKVGAGSEMYIPVGKSGERGIETEILSGQDIQINNDFMEMLRKAYISATGVPDVLLNYMNEADFAKTLELANTRFQGRVASYQLDFNSSISELYRRIMKYSSNIPDGIIDGFSFAFSAPKYSNANITSDMLGQFNTLIEFLVSLFIPADSMEDAGTQDVISEFKKLVARDRLPMLSLDKIEELFKEAQIKAGGEKVNPENMGEEES